MATHITHNNVSVLECQMQDPENRRIEDGRIDARDSERQQLPLQGGCCDPWQQWQQENLQQRPPVIYVGAHERYPAQAFHQGPLGLQHDGGAPLQEHEPTAVLVGEIAEMVSKHGLDSYGNSTPNIMPAAGDEDIWDCFSDLVNADELDENQSPPSTPASSEKVYLDEHHVVLKLHASPTKATRIFKDHVRFIFGKRTLSDLELEQMMALQDAYYRCEVVRSEDSPTFDNVSFWVSVDYAEERNKLEEWTEDRQDKRYVRGKDDGTAFVLASKMCLKDEIKNNGGRSPHERALKNKDQEIKELRKELKSKIQEMPAKKRHKPADTNVSTLTPNVFQLEGIDDLEERLIGVCNQWINEGDWVERAGKGVLVAQFCNDIKPYQRILQESKLAVSSAPPDYEKCRQSVHEGLIVDSANALGNYMVNWYNRDRREKMNKNFLLVRGNPSLRNKIKLRICRGSVVQFRRGLYAGLVCATNESCMPHCGGVTQAVAQAGGQQLLEDTLALPVLSASPLVRCVPGDAKMTTSQNLYGSLGVGHIIYAVGPAYSGDCSPDEETRLDGLLRSAYHASIARAKEKQLQTLAFSLLSAGERKSQLDPDRALGVAMSAIYGCEDFGSLQEILLFAYTSQEVTTLESLTKKFGQCSLSIESQLG